MLLLALACLCAGTLNPYHRTDSPIIRIKATYGYIPHQVSTMGIAAKGFDLYIRKDGTLWAESVAKDIARILSKYGIK